MAARGANNLCSISRLIKTVFQFPLLVLRQLFSKFSQNDNAFQSFPVQCTPSRANIAKMVDEYFNPRDDDKALF